MQQTIFEVNVCTVSTTITTTINAACIINITIKLSVRRWTHRINDFHNISSVFLSNGYLWMYDYENVNNVIWCLLPKSEHILNT